MNIMALLETWGGPYLKAPCAAEVIAWGEGAGVGSLNPISLTHTTAPHHIDWGSNFRDLSFPF